MPKIFSPADKEELRTRLLQNGLHLLAARGYKAVDVQDIADAVGGSRSFFYSLFSSREEFVMAAFRYQQAGIEQMLTDALALPHLTLEQQAASFIQDCMSNRKSQIFYMTQEDQVSIYRALSPEGFQAHQQSELAFYRRLIVAVGRNPDTCKAEVVGNLVQALLLTINSLASTPFMFMEGLAETIAFQFNMLCQYIFSH